MNYKIHVTGNDIGKISDVCAPPFQSKLDIVLDELIKQGNTAILDSIIDEDLVKQRGNLAKNGHATTEKVIIKTANTFVPSSESITVDMKEKLDVYLTNNMGKFQFLMIDPLMPHSFALAPSIIKMRQMINFGGIGVVHDYTKEES